MTLATTAALALAGCLLDEDVCGDGFVADGNRCLPSRAAWGDGALDDAALPDASASRGGSAVGEAPAEGWGGYSIVALLDQTPEDEDPDPERAGLDIDTLFVLPGYNVSDAYIGWADGVLNTPGVDPTAVGRDFDGRFVSLGAIGGRLFIQLRLERPLRSGDVIWIEDYVTPGEGFAERAAMYLCRAPLNPMEGCRWVGRVSGSSLPVELP